MTASRPPSFLSAALAWALAGALTLDAAPAATHEGHEKPNILVVVVADLGFSEVGAFGAEIDTPAIDALAATGASFGNFHVAPTAAQTRALLLGGEDHRLAATLRHAGYNTYASARGDLASQTQAFSRSHTAARNNPAPRSAAALTDRMIGFIRADADSGKPFFGYLYYPSAHHADPAAAPSAKYLAIHDRGWDAVRRERLRRQHALGLIPAPASDAALPRMPPWSALPDAEKRELAARMARYAATVETMDREIGRLVAALAEVGVYEDTAIIFLSGNGAGASAGYGPQWASVAATPFSILHGPASEGSLRVPLVISYPPARNRELRSTALTFVTDIAPTVLDIASVYDGSTPSPGRSLLPLLKSAASPVHPPEEVTVHACGDARCVYRDRYKLLTNGAPGGDGPWRLYDIVSDPAESADLGAAQRELASELRRALGP